MLWKRMTRGISQDGKMIQSINHPEQAASDQVCYIWSSGGSSKRTVFESPYLTLASFALRTHLFHHFEQICYCALSGSSV